MNNWVPIWILGAPFIGLLILAFSFKGPSAMGGLAPRIPVRRATAADPSTPLTDPMVPNALRRHP
jgi:hypothetical protein